MLSNFHSIPLQASLPKEFQESSFFLVHLNREWNWGKFGAFLGPLCLEMTVLLDPIYFLLWAVDQCTIVGQLITIQLLDHSFDI